MWAKSNQNKKEKGRVENDWTKSLINVGNNK
jgi:hypothetical protein